MMEPVKPPELVDPFNHYPLSLGRGYWFNPVNDEKYYINNGIPVFLPEEQMSGNNLKYSRFYDRISRFYRVSSVFYSWLKGSSDKKIKMKYLEQLQVRPGDKVLEVAVGSADNLLYLPRNASYSGLDISFGMLTMARRHLRKWNIPAGLYQGEAEHLPFAEHSFDVVFHVGGISLFNDSQRAIHEMIRVAKPGGQVMIVDDNEVSQVKAYHKNPFSPASAARTDEEQSAPVKLLPNGMRNIEVRYFFDSMLYCLTFRKPGQVSKSEIKPLADKMH